MVEIKAKYIYNNARLKNAQEIIYIPVHHEIAVRTIWCSARKKIHLARAKHYRQESKNEPPFTTQQHTGTNTQNTQHAICPQIDSWVLAQIDEGEYIMYIKRAQKQKCSSTVPSQYMQQIQRKNNGRHTKKEQQL